MSAERAHAVSSAPIADSLRRVLRRHRRMQAVRGTLAVLAVVGASLLLAMGIDYAVTLFAGWSRWLLLGMVVVATAMAGVWFLARPLLRSYTLVGVARALEARHPQLHERISSALELLSSRDRPEHRGSDALIAALAASAVAQSRQLHPRREVRIRSLGPWLLATTAVAAVMVGLLTAWPSESSRLLARTVLPHRNLANVAATDLRITPGRDVLLAEGERLRIEVVVANPRVRSAQLLTDSSGTDQAQPMTPLGPDENGWPRFAFTCPPAREDLRYRIHAGDALSAYFAVRVAPEPRVAGLTVSYQYPAYLGRPDVAEQDPTGDIRAVVNTRVTLTVDTPATVDAASLRVTGQAGEIPATSLEASDSGATRCRFQLTLQEPRSDRYRVVLRSRHGQRELVHVSPARDLIARPDRMPQVDLIQPAQTLLRLKPDDRLPVRFAVRDDGRIADATLSVEVDGRAVPSRKLRLTRSPSEGPGDLAEGRFMLDLGELSSQARRRVVFRVVARDNHPDGGQRGQSRRVALELDESAAEYVFQVTLSEELLVRQRLEEVLGHLTSAREHSSLLEKDLRKRARARSAPLTDKQVAHVEAVRGELAQADTLLRDAARAVAGSAYAGQAPTLQSIADDHVAPAANLTGQIRLTDDMKRRAALADEADFQVARATTRVEGLLAKLGALTEMVQRAMELQDLARRQARLLATMQAGGNSPTTWPTSLPADLAEMLAQAEPLAGGLQQWQASQGAVAGELTGLVRRTPSALAAQQKRDADRTADLASRYAELATLQAELVRQAELAGKLRKLAGKAEPQPGPGSGNRADKLARDWRQAETARLAHETRQAQATLLPAVDAVKKRSPQPDRIGTRIARAAENCAAHLGRNKLTDAAEAAHSAARLTRELARRLGGTPPRQPEQAADQGDTPQDASTRPTSAVRVDGSARTEPEQIGMVDHASRLQRREQADTWVSLAGRWESLAAQLKALAEGDLRGVSLARQVALNSRTRQAHEALSLVADHAQNLIADAEVLKLVRAAINRSAKARQHQDKAASVLAEDHASAGKSQGRAAGELSTVARLLDVLGQKLAERAGQADPDEPLAEAMEAAEQAARTAEPTDAARAARQLARLAERADRRARAAGLVPAWVGVLPGMASGGGSFDVTAALDDATAERLRELGIAPADWARLPGVLQTQILQGSEGQEPGEYRDLIRRYFRALAETASQPVEEVPR